MACCDGSLRRVLSAEAGLHVFEPSEGAATRVVARVRTEAVPLGPLSGAEEDNAIVLALTRALGIT